MRRLTFNVDDAVNCAGTGCLSGQWTLPCRQNAVVPGWRQIDAASTVAAGSSNTLRELIDVEIRAALVVLGKLQLVETQRQLIEKCRRLFHADDRSIKGLDVVTDSGIAPNACGYHQSDSLASA